MKPGICEAPRRSSLGLQGPMGIRATPCQPGPRLFPSRADLVAPLPRSSGGSSSWPRHPDAVGKTLAPFAQLHREDGGLPAPPLPALGGLPGSSPAGPGGAPRLLPCRPWAEGISFAQREAGGTAHRSEVSTRGQGVPRVPSPAEGLGRPRRGWELQCELCLLRGQSGGGLVAVPSDHPQVSEALSSGSRA